MRVAFLGSHEFGVIPLEALSKHFKSILVFSKSLHTPVGRKAAELKLETVAVRYFRLGESMGRLRDFKPDLGIVAGFGGILYNEALSIPRKGFINIHPSLLPRWRGPAPVQRAIMEGDRWTGVSLMKLTPGLDKGPLFLQFKERISERDTFGSLGNRLSLAGTKMLMTFIGSMDEFHPIPQNEDRKFPYASMIGKKERNLDFSGSASELDRRIRGLAPSPGAWGELQGEKVKFLMSCLRLKDGESSLAIPCGSGVLHALEMQRPGKRVLKADEFLRGFRTPAS